MTRRNTAATSFNAPDDKKKILEKAVSDLNATLNEIEWSATYWVSAHSHGQANLGQQGTGQQGIRQITSMRLG